MLRNGLEPWHLIVVALVVILVFGSKKLPDAARGLGKSMRILKAEAKALKKDDEAPAAAPTTTSPTPEVVVPSDVVTADETVTATPTPQPSPVK